MTIKTRSVLDDGLELTQPDGAYSNLIAAGKVVGEVRFRTAQVSFDHGTHHSGICPAGADTLCQVEGANENLAVSIDPAALALAPAEGNVLGSQINERLSGEDHELYDRARTVAAEYANGFPSGALYWNDVAASLI